MKAPSDRAGAAATALAAALATALLIRFVWLPLHGELSLNLVSVIEPYFAAEKTFQLVQVVLTLLVPYLAAPFVVAITFGAVRAATRAWLARRRGAAPVASQQRWRPWPARPPAGAPRWRAWPRRAWRGYAFTCLALLTVEVALYARFVVRAAAHPRGVVAFHVRCGQCHSHVRAFNHNFSADQWDETIARMHRYAETADLAFEPGERQAIASFLAAARGYDDRRLLAAKCFVCHLPTQVGARPRTREEWVEVVDRVQRTHPFYISKRDSEQLVDALATHDGWTLPTPKPGSGERAALEEKLAFERKCGTCHTLDVVLLPGRGRAPLTAAEWEVILRRMGRKVPALLDEDEALAFLPLILETVADEAELTSTFPHARRRERGR